MRKLIRKSSLGLIIVVMLLLSFGCVQDVEPESKLEVFTNVGFVSDLIQEYGEDGKSYVEFAVNEESLKLEVEDQDVFSSIKKDEFYKFAYKQDNVLLSIEADEYLENLVKESMEEGNTPDDEDGLDKVNIPATEKVSTEGLALLDSYEFDINGDGVEEVIAMYVNAEQGSDGEIYWDDGQDWLFLVEGQDQDHVLFNDYVQLGSIRFHIYTVDEDFYITTIQSGTANLDIMEYKFDKDSNEFISSLKHNATGNVNMMHSTYGY